MTETPKSRISYNTKGNKKLKATIVVSVETSDAVAENELVTQLDQACVELEAKLEETENLNLRAPVEGTITLSRERVRRHRMKRC
jgi:hypothetical protein